MKWIDFFPKGSSGVITLVGAGGKTSLMFHLAESLCELGHRVLATTTTKMAYPAPYQSPSVVIMNDTNELVARLEKEQSSFPFVTAVAAQAGEKNHLVGYPADVINTIAQTDLFDWILIEGDGASQKHLKAPTCYEPVIPECSDWVIGVVGLSVIGKPLSEKNVHRSALFSHRTDLPMGSAITPDAVAAILVHPNGILKGAPENAKRIIFLNHGEIPENALNAYSVIQKLSEPEPPRKKKRTPEKLKIHQAIIGAALYAPHIIHLHNF